MPIERVVRTAPVLTDGARHVYRRLVAAGERALLAGGAVRDHLLGRPAKDVDIASSATPERVAALFDRTVMVGAHFGVAKVVLGEETIEVVTFRADLEYQDGRHPVGVRYSSEEEDALRRDFTVNGLFYDLDAGCVVDYVGGLADLEARRLRAIGDPRSRFREDRLRLLRAVRFAVVLGFEIEDRTWAAVLDEAPGIQQVSAERIRDELEKILVHPRRELGYFMLSDSGLMAQILPEIEALRDVPQPPEYHPEGDVHRHTGMVLGELRAPTFPLALGALLHDIGKASTFSITDRIRFNRHETVGAAMAEVICDRLRLSRREKEEVCFLVQRHMVLPGIPAMRVARQQRLFDEPAFEALLRLGHADCMGSHRNVSAVETARSLYEDYRAAGPPAEPLVRGRDLIELGVAPGPLLGKLLREAFDAQRDGDLSSREEALEWLRRRFPEAWTVASDRAPNLDSGTP
ncbi:MAG: CCA tRNA nucleotidyltransferase [Planctomycetota bacterium]